MNCCLESEMPLAEGKKAALQRDCVSCKWPGRAVTLKTMFLMLRPQVFDQIGQSEYRFCASPDCPVVYFSRERSFTTGDLRVQVGLKEKDGPITLCYCFGFYEQDLRTEITTNGRTTIPQRISALIKERMCACEVRNPSGSCCLGEVTQAAKRLTKEAGCKGSTSSLVT